MATSTRLVLQPHLRERLTAVQSLLGPELRSELEAVLAQPLLAEVEAPRRASGLVAERPQAEIAPTTEKKKEDDSHSSATGVGAGRTEGDPEKAAGVEDEKQTEGEEDRPEVVPPTVDVELLDRLARWAEGKEAALRDAGLGELHCTAVHLADPRCRRVLVHRSTRGHIIVSSSGAGAGAPRRGAEQ